MIYNADGVHTVWFLTQCAILDSCDWACPGHWHYCLLLYLFEARCGLCTFACKSKLKANIHQGLFIIIYFPLFAK